jgi:hypothetical protein
MTESPLWIDPASIRFRLSEDGRLHAEWNGKRDRVEAGRLFPATFPDGFVAIRDSSGQEWGVLRSMEGLEAASRDALEVEMRFRPFLPRITRIRSIRRRFGEWLWYVRTDAGHIRFCTGPLYESTTLLPNGCRLVTDVSDRKFWLTEEASLDAGSRAQLRKWL